MRLKRCSLHERWQTEFRVSSLNSLNLARVGELALSTMVKPRREQMVIPSSVERLNVSSSVESLWYLWPWGQQVKDKRRMERKKNEFLHFLTSHILSGVFNYSCRVFVCVWVCVLYICVYVCLCSCVCVASRRGSRQDPGTGFPAHQDLTKGTDGALWGVLSARSLPAFGPATSPPHPSHPHPPQPAVHGLCNFIKAPGHSFMVKPWPRGPLRIWVSRNAWPHVRVMQSATIKTELIIWVICNIGGWPANHTVSIATAAVIVLY